MGPPKGCLPSGTRPGSKGVARRNHEAPLIPWNGRANRSRDPLESFGPNRRDHAKRVSVVQPARRLLRKSSGAPGKRAHPADAFCGQRPCPRATTQASRKCQSRHRRDPRQSRGFTLRKFFLPPAFSNPHFQPGSSGFSNGPCKAGWHAEKGQKNSLFIIYFRPFGFQCQMMGNFLISSGCSLIPFSV